MQAISELSFTLLQAISELSFKLFGKYTSIETALKTYIALMKKGNINEGKSLILKEVHSKLNYSRTGNGKFNCYGSENSVFSCLFSHIWKMQAEQKCTSSYYSNNNAVMTRFQATFSAPSSSSSKLKDIDTIFPVPGDSYSWLLWF